MAANSMGVGLRIDPRLERQETAPRGRLARRRGATNAGAGSVDSLAAGQVKIARGVECTAAVRRLLMNGANASLRQAQAFADRMRDGGMREELNGTVQLNDTLRSMGPEADFLNVFLVPERLLLDSETDHLEDRLSLAAYGKAIHETADVIEAARIAIGMLFARNLHYDEGAQPHVNQAFEGLRAAHQAFAMDHFAVAVASTEHAISAVDEALKHSWVDNAETEDQNRVNKAVIDRFLGSFTHAAV